MTQVLALTGGVGGAKLAVGLAANLGAEELSVVANTGDDFEHLGLHIAPDLDSVMYALAGLNDSDRGWGVKGESWQAMSALEQLQGETWFRLGDKDLATHLQRSQLLRDGLSLSEATAKLCEALGIPHPLIPMSDQPVRTQILTEQGELAFQHYFVREQCEPSVLGFRFEGIEQAKPSAKLMASLQNPELSVIIICPSNPFVSVDPILKLPGVLSALQKSSAPIIAVSPIVGGLAIKGPAGKMMKELNMPTSAAAVAAYYGDLLDGFVLDNTDSEQCDRISVPCLVTDTIMTDNSKKSQLAQDCLRFAASL